MKYQNQSLEKDINSKRRPKKKHRKRKELYNSPPRIEAPKQTLSWSSLAINHERLSDWEDAT